MLPKAVAAIIIRSARLLSGARNSLPSWTRTCTTTCVARGAGDTNVHLEGPQGEDAEQTARTALAEEERRERQKAEGRENTRPSAPPTFTTHSSPSCKLENSTVNPTPDPLFQQKRSSHTRPNDDAIETVECVGIDGGPEYDEKKDDFGEYYKEHKASPLSEIAYVDTRVPLRQATDYASDVYDEYGRKEVITFNEEQRDTAEEALLRAEALFRAAAENGDPDTPWGRVLAGVRRY